MKKLWQWLLTNWILLFIFIIAIIITLSIHWYKLGTLTPGFSTNEITQIETINSGKKIIKNPIGAPLKVPQYIAHKLKNTAAVIRTASTLIGIITVTSMYLLLNSWYPRRTAIFASVLLISSAWFLGSVRNADNASLFLILFSAFAATSWQQRSTHKQLPLLVSALLIVSLLYTTGMIWIVAVLSIWKRKSIITILKQLKITTLAMYITVGTALIAPLIFSLIKDIHLIKYYLGLPEVLPSALQFATNIVNIAVELFVRGPVDSSFWLGDFPLLRVFVSIMFVIGIYSYVKNYKLDRTPLLALIFLTSSVLIGLGGPVKITILLPFIIMVAATGIDLLLREWRGVFPRNPYAKIFGTISIGIVVGLTAYQGLRQYFIAWPKTPETKQVYQHQLK